MRKYAVVAAVACTALLPVAPAVAADTGSAPSAAPADTDTTQDYNLYKANVTSVERDIKFLDQGPIATCQVGTTGGTCTAQTSKSATREIGLALGVSRGAVAADLSISASVGVGVSASCTSPALKAGDSWGGYAVGDRYNYTVTRTTYSNQGIAYSSVESSPLQAYDPNPSKIYCQSVASLEPGPRSPHQ